MHIEQLQPRDVSSFRLMQEKSIALHGSVGDALDMAEEQIALSLKIVSRSKALIAETKRTLKRSNKIRAGFVNQSSR